MKKSAIAEGVWDGGAGRIIISRDQLESVRTFAGTMLHEVTHLRSGGASDLTRGFEQALTELLGEVAEAAINDACNRRKKPYSSSWCSW